MKNLKLLSLSVLMCLTPIVYSMEQEITLEYAQRLLAEANAALDASRDDSAVRESEAILTAACERTALLERTIIELREQLVVKDNTIADLRRQLEQLRGSGAHLG